MTQALATNVELIKDNPAKTPRKFEAKADRGSVLGRTVQSAAAIPIVGAGIQIEFGYNLRRLTRIITQKAKRRPESVAAARQVGVDASYIWRTSMDERVRTTHEENNGKTFAWASPPLATGHPGNDVQCRCSQRASVITPANRARLKGHARKPRWLGGVGQLQVTGYGCFRRAKGSSGNVYAQSNVGSVGLRPNGPSLLRAYCAHNCHSVCVFVCNGGLGYPATVVGHMQQ